MSKLTTTIQEFTSPSPITAKPKDSLEEIQKQMDANGIRHIPIVIDKKTVGIISQRDLKVALAAKASAKLIAEDIMAQEVLSVSLETSLESAAFEMSKNKVGSLIVEDINGELYGVFTTTDALNALIEAARGDLDS